MYRFSLATSLQLGMALTDVDVTIKSEASEAFRERGGLLTVFSLRWSRDTSDDRVYPTRGKMTWLLADWAPSISLSESYFVSLQGTSSWYGTILGSTVLASRLSFGLAAPIGDSPDLLPNRRFYAGGPTSMRGAGRRKLGPRDTAGGPLGGEALVLWSTELRYPLFWLIGGALFVDAGQVFSHHEEMNLADLEVAVGPGLMIRTPVGPIRADVAWNLTDRPAGEPGTVFHLSVGNPF
jgi:outer membrane translocation and assembly module TamA